MSSFLNSIQSLLVIQLLLVISYGSIYVSAWNYTSTGEVSALETEEINQYLEKINKPAVKSIESPDGDIIDCVLIDKQLAFDNPLLKNHRIQMVPSMIPTYKDRNFTINTESVRQVWNDVGSCPYGTVSIRRIKTEDVLRFGSLAQYGRKPLNYISRTLTGPISGHEYAVVLPSKEPDSIYGSIATFNVWNPYVEVDYEFSLSQLWVCAGSYDDQSLNTIEAGWQVYSGIYGDNSTRLFIYWTRNAYNGTGCYNHGCPGFVQTTNSIAVGGALSNVSKYNDKQYEMKLQVWKDQRSGNWWLKFDDTFVGYWPSEIFTLLRSGAGTWMEWGGEIVNTSPNGTHTSTQMGSSHFPEEGHGKASYVRNIMIVNSNLTVSPPKALDIMTTNTNCYNAKLFNDTDLGVSFYFGGPGKSSQCP